MTYLPFSLSLTHTHTQSCVHTQMYDFCLGCKTCLGPIGKTGHRSWMIRVDKKQHPLMVKLGNIPPHSSNQKPCYPNSFKCDPGNWSDQPDHTCGQALILWVVPCLFVDFLVAQLVKNPSAIQETPVWFLGWVDLLEKGKATHSSILAWRILWTV